MKEAEAELGITFTIECPHCGREIDLTCSDYEGVFMELLFTFDKGMTIQDALKDEEIDCPRCEREFMITGTCY